MVTGVCEGGTCVLLRFSWSHQLCVATVSFASIRRRCFDHPPAPSPPVVHTHVASPHGHACLPACLPAVGLPVQEAHDVTARAGPGGRGLRARILHARSFQVLPPSELLLRAINLVDLLRFFDCGWPPSRQLVLRRRAPSVRYFPGFHMDDRAALRAEVSSVRRVPANDVQAASAVAAGSQSAQR